MESDDTRESMSSESEEFDKKQDNDVEPDEKSADEDDFELTNEIPTTTAKEPEHYDNVKHGGGYHASSAPTDFMKKKYTSELLHVSRCTVQGWSTRLALGCVNVNQHLAAKGSWDAG